VKTSTKAKKTKRGVPEIDRVYYIGASAKKVWAALTKAAETRHYYFGLTLRSRLRKGSGFDYIDESGDLTVQGKLLTFVKEKEIVHTFAFRRSIPGTSPRASRTGSNRSDRGSPSSTCSTTASWE